MPALLTHLDGLWGGEGGRWETTAALWPISRRLEHAASHEGVWLPPARMDLTSSPSEAVRAVRRVACGRRQTFGHSCVSSGSVACTWAHARNCFTPWPHGGAVKRLGRMHVDNSVVFAVRVNLAFVSRGAALQRPSRAHSATRQITSDASSTRLAFGGSRHAREHASVPRHRELGGVC